MSVRLRPAAQIGFAPSSDGAPDVYHRATPTSGTLHFIQCKQKERFKSSLFVYKLYSSIGSGIIILTLSLPAEKGLFILSLTLDKSFFLKSLLI